MVWNIIILFYMLKIIFYMLALKDQNSTHFLKLSHLIS